MVELTSHDQPADDERNDALYELAASTGTAVIATGNVHYATPRDARLAQALAAVRARRSLDEMDGWLAASGAAYLRSGAEMADRLRRYPGVAERTMQLARDCAFDFQVIAPRLPVFPVPGKHTEATWLRSLVAGKAPQRYGPPDAERVKGAYAQIARELDVIEELGFPGYFLIVHDIVRFCEQAGILCQGRGSGRELGRLLRAGDHQRGSRPARTCFSSGSCQRAGTARPTSTWTSSTGAGRRSSSTSTASTAGTRPPRSPT